MSRDTVAAAPASARGAGGLAVPWDADHTAATVRGWIHSPAYDLALFILSPAAGLLVVWAMSSSPSGRYVFLASFYLIAIPHYLSSFSFFLGDENLSYYRTRWMAFFVGPFLILAAVTGLYLADSLRPVFITNFVWNIYHVSLQSAGILSLYRRLNAGPQSERPVAHLAILAVSATMAFWHIDRYPPLFDTLAALHPAAPWLLRAATLPVAAGAVGVLLFRVARRPRPISLPEASFLASSLLLFHPYLWVDDINVATFGMLMGHFIQYLAIVWLLNLRKYAAAGGSARQRLLGRISARPSLIIIAILATGTLFFAAERLAYFVGVPIAYAIGWNTLVIVHFYIDGLVWAFKQPFVQQSIGPYLTPASHRVAA